MSCEKSGLLKYFMTSAECKDYAYDPKQDSNATNEKQYKLNHGKYYPMQKKSATLAKACKNDNK